MQFLTLIPYTLRKKGTKAVTRAVPFQKVHIRALFPPYYKHFSALIQKVTSFVPLFLKVYFKNHDIKANT